MNEGIQTELIQSVKKNIFNSIDKNAVKRIKYGISKILTEYNINHGVISVKKNKEELSIRTQLNKFTDMDITVRVR